MSIHTKEELKKMMDEIADRLRLERISRGYTQEQFAEILDMSSRQYGRYENKKSEIPINKMYGLSSVGVSGYYLLVGKIEQDVIIQHALETIPAEKLLEVLDVMAKDTDENVDNQSIQKDIDDMIKELLSYGREHFDDKKLRKVPEFRHFTDCYEMYRASLIEKNKTNPIDFKERDS